MISKKFNLADVFKVVVITCVLSGLAGAADGYWTDASGVNHLYSTAANWGDVNGVPGVGVPVSPANAWVNLTGHPMQITTGTFHPAMLAIGYSGVGQVDMTGGTLNCTGSPILVGQVGTGTFNQSGGLTKNDTTFVGDYDGTGVMNLSGTAVFLATGNILAGARGSAGTGTVNVTDTAQIITPYIAVAQQDIGTLNLSGHCKVAVAQILWAGVDGIGTVNISGDANLTVGAHIYVPYATGTSDMNISSGTVTINQAFLVGCYDYGTGTVTMTGGKVTCGVLFMGDVPTGTAHIQLNGGTLQTSNLQMRANGGVATIDITGGTLILPGAVSGNAYITSGWITAYGGTGTFVFTVDDVNGTTAITAVPPYIPKFCGDLNTIYLAGDLNKDCKVDFKDFAEFAGTWMNCTDPANALCRSYWPL